MYLPLQLSVNSSVLNDPPQNTPSRYSFASPSPPPGIFAGALLLSLRATYQSKNQHKYILCRHK